MGFTLIFSLIISDSHDYEIAFIEGYTHHLPIGHFQTQILHFSTLLLAQNLGFPQ